MNKKSLDNMIPPKKGEIRNPNGRPKGSLNSKTILLKFLALRKTIENLFNDGASEEFTLMELINLKQIANAMDGDLHAYREIMDRTEGKVTQQIDATTNGESLNDKPFVIHIDGKAMNLEDEF
jgi:hypothetical protein